MAVFARRLGRPVKWIEDRRENLVAATHAKEQVVTLEAAVTAEGRILGMRAKLIGDGGGYSFNTASVLVEPLHAAQMMPLFKESPADVIHLEFTNKNFDELEAFRDFPTDKVLGVGVVDAKNLQVETAEQIEARIRRGLEVVPADRLLVAPDCGLGYFSRTAAYAKLRNMGQAAASVRATL